MRIRKRLHSLVAPPDLSSSSAPSMAAVAAVEPPAGAAGRAAGNKEEVMAAAVAAARGGLPGSGAPGSGGAAAEDYTPIGIIFQPSPSSTGAPPYRPPSAVEGEERGDLPPPGPRFLTRNVLFDHDCHGEVWKREQDGENGGDHGDAHSRWHMETHSTASATATAPKSLGAVSQLELSLVHGGCSKTLPNGVPAATEAMTKLISRDERELPPMKRRRCYRPRGTRAVCEEEGEVAEEEEKKPRPTKTRRRAAAASAFTAIAFSAGTSTVTTVGSGSGAPTVAGAAAAKECEDDDVVKEEEGGPTSARMVSDGGTNRGAANANGKKRRSPAVLMEGSRCSRVNGRGWRCCQQTLVGYSLCEHHLGKGRLRSVSSVRYKGRARKKEEVGGAAPSSPPSPLPQQQQQQQYSSSLVAEEDEEEEEQNPGKRRRKKIGMVKARSISSLLHQPNTTVAATAAPAPSLAICKPSPGGHTSAVTTGAAPPHDRESVAT